MYTAYFGMREKPFSITPNPRYLFLSEQHREALAHLLYGVGESGGFVQLTGEVGTGKTTVCRAFLEQLPEQVEVALILNPRMTPAELLRTTCQELRVEVPAGASTKELIDRLNSYLLQAHAAGRRVVLIIDEAQNLSADVLEQVRLLTNLETDTHKLLQIFLIGQPELRELLATRSLRQVEQRITARHHLAPLTADETRRYIRHRLAVAGADPGIFSAGAQRRLYRVSDGVPRLVNILCDRALLGAYANDRKRVSGRMVAQAARELGHRLGAPRLAATAIAAAAALLLWLAAPLDLEGILWRPAAAVGAHSTFWPQLKAAGGADRRQAEWDLLHLWGVEEAPPEGELCRDSDAYGLACRRWYGSWNSLRMLNRPALIELREDSGEPRYAVVSRLDQNQVTLLVAGKQITAPLTEVDRFWLGDHLVLWHPPLPGIAVIGPDSQGDAVAWVRMALSEEGFPSEGDGTYDAALAELVREFQRREGLEADGLIGTRTFIRLNTLLGEPALPLIAPRGGD